MRAFIEAIDRDERTELSVQLALLVTAQSGDSAEIKRFAKELAK